MTLDMTRLSLKMKSVRAACHDAPDGAWRDVAFKHYKTAEFEHLAQREAATDRELEAALRALALGRSSKKRRSLHVQTDRPPHSGGRHGDAMVDPRRMTREMGGS